MKANTKRSTIYFDSDLHQALQIKAIQIKSTISDLVNDAVKISLAEDLQDLEAFAKRAKEPSFDFKNVLKDLKKSGKL